MKYKYNLQGTNVLYLLLLNNVFLSLLEYMPILNFTKLIRGLDFSVFWNLIIIKNRLPIYGQIFEKQIYDDYTKYISIKKDYIHTQVMTYPYVM